MFSKRAKDGAKPSKTSENLPALLPADVAAATGARPKLLVASLLSESLTVEGNVLGEGEVQIDGVVRGDVRVGKLTIGETGHVEGQIFCETIEVRGRVIGTITAKQVRLYGTAYVDGDVTHEQLAIETGAFFQGRSLKFQRPAPNLQAVETEETPTAAAV
jgi:cytoskeletal protein CcmA (bactofilin family)